MLGTILPSQVLGRYMANQEAGVILNFSSMTSVRPLAGVVGYRSQAGIERIPTEWLAVYIAQSEAQACRVNTLRARLLHRQAESSRACATTTTASPTRPAIIDHTPMSRFGEPGELRRRTLAALRIGASSPASSCPWMAAFRPLAGYRRAAV